MAVSLASFTFGIVAFILFCVAFHIIFVLWMDGKSNPRLVRSITTVFQRRGSTAGTATEQDSADNATVTRRSEANTREANTTIVRRKQTERFTYPDNFGSVACGSSPPLKPKSLPSSSSSKTMDEPVKMTNATIGVSDQSASDYKQKSASAAHVQFDTSKEKGKQTRSHHHEHHKHHHHHRSKAHSHRREKQEPSLQMVSALVDAMADLPDDEILELLQVRRSQKEMSAAMSDTSVDAALDAISLIRHLSDKPVKSTPFSAATAVLRTSSIDCANQLSAVLTTADFIAFSKKMFSTYVSGCRLHDIDKVIHKLCVFVRFRCVGEKEIHETKSTIEQALSKILITASKVLEDVVLEGVTLDSALLQRLKAADVSPSILSKLKEQTEAAAASPSSFPSSDAAASSLPKDTANSTAPISPHSPGMETSFDHIAPGFVFDHPHKAPLLHTSAPFVPAMMTAASSASAVPVGEAGLSGFSPTETVPHNSVRSAVPTQRGLRVAFATGGFNDYADFDLCYNDPNDLTVGGAGGQSDHSDVIYICL